jgi:DNA helicase-2/ATP-dependent DNA helicase PcrA
VLSETEFVRAVRTAERFRHSWLNDEQHTAVMAAANRPIFIVAGPGTGKTTVLALRVLKLILVDGLAAEAVVATTFTRKAATELRSRILSWGYQAVRGAMEFARNAGDPDLVARLAQVDVNGVRIGTLDALAEEFITECRLPGEILPATIEGFLVRGLARQHALWPDRRYQDADLAALLRALTPRFPFATSFADRLDAVIAFIERVRHDGVDLQLYRARDRGSAVLVSAADDYFAALEENHYADFGRLEVLLHDRVRARQLERVTTVVRAILVDEFQDTNFLQERVYFEFCRTTGASLSVVGDDDQSIYRFRGATVELFANFEQRLVTAMGDEWRPHRVNLFRNYRSTQRIVDFCNHFVTVDQTYQPARVPNKSQLVASGVRNGDPAWNVPILGMFRNNIQQLATGVADFLSDIFRADGARIVTSDREYVIGRSTEGDFGDAVFLSRSVRERTAAAQPRDRLPLAIRNEFDTRGIRVFNPRGRSLRDHTHVQQLLGLALECIDPNADILNGIQTISPQHRNAMLQWRNVAAQFRATDPAPGGLDQFVDDWQRRNPRSMATWPREWPLLELIFALVTWLPDFQHDPEGQVYLEAVTRTVAEAAQASPYRGVILHGTQRDPQSVQNAIRMVFEAIADEIVDVDEEIIPDVPRNRFPLMTVHQAKGLEFPLVVLDVGSDYQRAHAAQAAARFPVQGDVVHVREDDVAAFSPVGPMRSGRPAVDRAWDDLRRLYFVACSRPQYALLLVGHTNLLRQPSPIPAIGMGDVRGNARAITFVPAASFTSDMLAGSVALI